MKEKEIKELLSKFYDGASTKGDENILIDYFTGDNIANELRQEKDIFLSFFQDNIDDMPADLENKLTILIDDLDSKNKKMKFDFNSWKVTLIAVALVILLSLPFSLKKNATIQFTDKDMIALNDAQEALLLVSQKLNKGMNQLNVIPTQIDKTSKVIKEINKK